VTRLSFTTAERRALYALLALLAVGTVVQLYSRFYPRGAPGYVIEVDTLALPEAAPVESAAAVKLAAGIDPNLAPQEDLELLPGIGPSLAQRIIAYREAHGPFANLEALARVPGIGEALIERLRPHLRFP
jgi:competence ComEA-like helix-hairpin-helix protein